jgi:predicted phosphodiesterase
MRRFIRFLLYKPIVWLVVRFSSRPDQKRVNKALTSLHRSILHSPGKKGPLLSFDKTSRLIVFSDQHKGSRNGADIFAMAEPNYLAALAYYNKEKFHFISLGDNEELWENSLNEIKKHNQQTFLAEQKFAARQAFTKIFGNHDLYWQNDPFAPGQLKSIYQTDVTVYEGLILQTKINGNTFSIYCTHGHQGDKQSDGNWFSKFFVANIWGPLQAYLHINPNTPSCNDTLKTVHNQLMYAWSAKHKDLLLITGHTHQPVFESLTHHESLYQKLESARKENKTDRVQALEKEISLHGTISRIYSPVKPSYFNSGCCCFDDGDITGIEIAEGKIRLVKWDRKKGLPSGESIRIVLEETELDTIAPRLTN